MRNPMSPGDTPSQRHSTLTISPFISNRSARNHSTSQHQIPAASHGDRLNGERTDPPAAGNRSLSGALNPFHTLINSPLGQKVTKTLSVSSFNTPHQVKVHNGGGNNTSRNNMFGYTVPSTLRKVSLQREYKDPSNFIPKGSSAPQQQDLPGDPSTTTLTTNTVATTAANEIDISELSSVDKLRYWRHDALMQHMLTTAEYVGDKVYSITGDPNDAFWLAQVYYNKGEYIRAINYMAIDSLDSVNVMCRYLMGLCLIELQRYDDALDVVGETNPYASEEIPSAHISEDTETSRSQETTDGGVKLESSLCFLRGKIFCALNNFSSAKDAFKEAIAIDVKNFEAFNELTSKSLLTPQQEWDLIETLDFSILDDNEDIIKNFYVLRLSKLINKERTEAAQRLLAEEYNLDSNVDYIHSNIEILFSQCKFGECLHVCEAYLSKDEFNPKILPIYISCLYEVSAKNKLFLLSHQLTEKFPKKAISWFSVATYYMCMSKLQEARTFFAKSSMLDPTFAPAWLGFAHTYALEGEQDQALSAYSTAARFFPGSHLPNLFLGMQYMSSNTLSLAEEYFTLAYDICDRDPLVLNEMGVMYYKKEDYEKSKKFLKRAAEETRELDSNSKTAISIQTNLGHTYKKLGDYEHAIKCFKYILEDSERDVDTYCTLGFLYLKTNQLQKAVDILHRALAIEPSNQNANEMLVRALELNVAKELDSDHPLVMNSYEMNPLKNRDNTALSRKRTLMPFLQSSGLSKRSKRNEHGPIESPLEGPSKVPSTETNNEMMDLE
ncbi:anaphase promoting complex subunit CDC16 KNAG_0H00160 [Huiozyma naganishii CBS 8797]|uniref:Anaphase-promoting complex subunit CDC16 n=1 Tax=Huiozyma naganishii (strain ATCC MYA-139 / BCRC 22969 / CBS 8797 / KCTC 17520 / NBRC 10181 / NCYC 3082 / Yp74L-3) TaxID=1071383 RepID=J7S1F2_HUIN7|nr:hypothetical protein KNAG_0H00160 [Kazachstania naganishii CBS 8797]CCK71432.1 hypothetical protein KNAG_0H00160 [Kazachstania naganishii CBS 8797]